MTYFTFTKILLLALYFGTAYADITALGEDITEDAQAAPANPVDQVKSRLFPDQWLELPLDHFNLFDNRTWNMRYLENRRFFKSGGSIFIEIGGEWTIGDWSASKPQITKLAANHSGIYFATEHRYYGKSLPFSTNFSVPNLKYLQVEQALEDLAFFIDYIKSSNSDLKDSKVIVHGCSYGGMLATWMRSRFPHLVDIGYASSAPLSLDLDYSGYYEVINEVYGNVTVSCIDTIKKGFNITINLLETTSGRKIVNDALKNWACGDVRFMPQLSILMKMVRVLNIQNDAHHYEEISCLVLLMDTDDSSAFERLANMVVLKSQDKGGCAPSGGTKKDGPDDNTTGWLYQVCTELGLFQSISSRNPHHPIELDLSLKDFLEICTQLFGNAVTEEVLRTGNDRMKRRYGGRNIKTTKLLTVQGTHDPWKKVGMLKEVNAETPLILLDGSHCVDTAERKDDPEELAEGRERIRNIISGWIYEISTTAP